MDKEYPIEEELEEAYKTINQLTNNWRLLEEVIKDMLFTTPHEDKMLNFILGKMKEIERGNNEG